MIQNLRPWLRWRFLVRRMHGSGRVTVRQLGETTDLRTRSGVRVLGVDRGVADPVAAPGAPSRSVRPGSRRSSASRVTPHAGEGAPPNSHGLSMQKM